MAESMINRVAWAIAQADNRNAAWDIAPDFFLEQARAAIEEMRRPTERMIEGPAKSHMDSYSSNLAWWNAMINSALEP